MKTSTAQDLLPLIEKIRHLLNKDSFKEVETLLLEKTERIQDLTLEEMITYLRGTFSNRQRYLTAWDLFKEAAVREVEKTDLNAEQIFIGLL